MIAHVVRLGLVGAFCALTLLMAPLTHAFAHPLPASVLTFSPYADSLELVITLPVQELVHALPEITALRDTPAGAALPPETLDILAPYFAAHVKLGQGNLDLPLKLRTASLRAATHEDIGHYTLLVVTLTAPLPGPDAQINLSYDAVMHEVRNHRAAVFWAENGKTPLPLAEFGLHVNDGKPTSVPLTLP